MLEEDVIKLKVAVRKLETFLAPQIKKAEDEAAKSAPKPKPVEPVHASPQVSRQDNPGT